MKANEFPLKLTPDGSLAVPDALRSKLPYNQVGRVIVLIDKSSDIDEQTDWSRLSAEQFLPGYKAADAVYDKIK
jgi:hypothetical protein